MKPNITVYSSGGPGETKKLDSFIAAAFWIGVDHAESDLESVKVRLPSESYDTDVASLLEFTALLVQRQINFSVEFFTEPPQRDSVPTAEGEPTPDDVDAPAPAEGDQDFEKELSEAEADYQKGRITREQYMLKKAIILKKWRKKVEGRLRS